DGGYHLCELVAAQAGLRTQSDPGRYPFETLSDSGRNLRGRRDDAEGLNDVVVDQLCHVVPSVLLRQSSQFDAEISPTMQIEYRPVRGGRAVERNLFPDGRQTRSHRFVRPGSEEHVRRDVAS